MSSYQWPSTGTGGSSGVSSINSLTGAIQFLAGTGITLTPSGNNITIASTGGVTTGNLTESGSANLTITGGTGAVVGTGTLLTLTGSSIVEATSSVLAFTGATNAVLGTGVSIQVKQAATAQSGYLSSTDWNTFSAKQGAISLTTTGSSGAATLIGTTLNIPQYSAGTGTVTTVSVVSANGLAGTVATATSTPAITLSTSVTGVVKGNGAALSAATAGTDYSLGTSANTTGLVKSTTGTGALTTAVAGTDYQAPVSLTTTGTTGPATLITNTLNIPNYSSPLTTKGDIFTFSTVNARQAVPSDYGDLIADSAQATGWRSAGYTQTQGKPGKNYIQYADFENGATTGWTQGTVGTLTNGIPTGTPTFGSGASGTSAIAVVTSGQLAGTTSLSYANTAATTVGNMLASSAYAIDAEDQAKVLTFRFYYSVPTGSAAGNFSGTSSNTFGIAVYDVTNASFLGSTANFGMTQTTGVGYVTGTCQTNINTATIRYIIYCANASTGAITLFLDDFYLGPQTAPLGAVVTDWQNYIPIFVGLGTVVSPNFKSRRVGDSLEVTGYFTTGTGTATEVLIGLGYAGGTGNVVADTTKVPAASPVGDFEQSGAGGSYFGGAILSPATNQSYVNIGLQESTTSAMLPVNGSAIGPGSICGINFKIPIVGWSSNVQMSSDTDTRVIGAKVNLTTNQSITNSTNTLCIFNSIESDTSGSYSTSTGLYTCSVSGYYTVSTNGYLSTVPGSSTNAALVYKNGSLYAQLSQTGGSYLGGGSVGNIKCSAGDTLSVEFSQISGGTLSIGGAPTLTWASFQRASGPSVIAATESVNATYGLTTAQAVAANAVLKYDTKVKDTHNSFSTSTGLYTVPVSGEYQINAAVSALTLTSAYVKVGAAGKGYLTSAPNSNQIFNGLISIPLNAGDMVGIFIDTSTTMQATSGNGFTNSFSITRVGN